MLDSACGCSLVVAMVTAEREDGRLKVEMKRAHSRLEDIQEQMNIYEVD